MHVRLTTYEESLAAIRAVRDSVFGQEQMVPREKDWDGMDPHCIHVVARVNHAITGLLLSVLLVAGLTSVQLGVAAAASGCMLADFERVDAISLMPDQAEARVLAVNGGHVLEVVAKAGAAYPAVRIEPRQGRWDLSRYDGVEMEVSNPEDAALRVLLSINNPGADGRKNCNTESVTVPAGGKAVLQVPFGMWHGDPNHPLDQSNIVSVVVLLDKPDRTHRFMVDNIRAMKFEEGLPAAIMTNSFYRALKPYMGRGVNLGNALEAPSEGAWGVKLEAKYFELIRNAGFDSVRIPVRWSAHAGASAPFTIEPDFLRRVDWAVQQALSHHLAVVLNMHHYDAFTSDPDGHRKRFVALWEQIARHYKDQPAALAFELLNEPHDKLDADRWNQMLADALTVVRRTNHSRQVVIGPVGWNAIKDLPGLKLPEADRNLVVTFHYYSPFAFTHQGASWAGKESATWLGTKWTGTPTEQMMVNRDLDAAITWAVEHRRPIYMGEFGAYSKADMESRARWTSYLASESLKRKIGFAYWEFCAGFGVYDRSTGQWVEPLKAALCPAKIQKEAQ